MIFYKVWFVNNIMTRSKKDLMLNFIKEITEKFLKNIYWIICAIFSFGIFLISYFISSIFPPFNDGILYLLSSISQALAAIFALVFTIIIMVASMSKNYSAIDKFFNKKTQILMIIFVIGIILPLFLLKFDINTLSYIRGQIYNVVLSVSIGLAAFCIAAIIPLLRNYNEIVKFDIGVYNLTDKLNEATKLENYPRAESTIYDLKDIGLDAIKEKNEKPLLIITNVISNYIQIGLNRSGGILPLFSPYVAVLALSEMGKSATEKGMDKFANSIIHDLQMSGKLMINKDVSAEEIIVTLQQIGIEAIKNKMKYTAIFYIQSLLVLGNEASSEKRWKHLSDMAYSDFGVGVAHLEKYFHEEADNVCFEIKSLDIEINDILSTESKDSLNNKIPGIEGYFEKFLKRYNSF